jgi:hypothetical protein
MVGKKILLTLNPEMHAVLEQKAKDNLMTIQEFIADTLRKRVLPATASAKK